MQAMNLHPAQQDILLNLLNVQPGKAQGMSNTPQGEMSFSSMLELADKTYSTEGKNTLKPQDASPKTEAPSKKENEPREDTSVRNEKTDERTSETDSDKKVKTEDRTEAFDTEKADAEINSVTTKAENLVNEGGDAEEASLTMQEENSIKVADSENSLGETVISENAEVDENPDASVLEDTKLADKNALAARLETKPVTDADAAAETEKAADESETEGVSSDRKTKKKDELSDSTKAAELLQADNPAVNAEQALPDSENSILAAIQSNSADVANQENKIEIIDERTHAENADASLNTTVMVNSDGSSAEMVMTLPVQAAGSEANGSMEAGYSKADFSKMLSNSLAASKDEFVKTGSIILQDNKKGSINLILHPEELGNVKVKLELSDNQITGKIVVASKEAYDAFRQNLEDIRNAFVANGFDACGFDLAWAGAGDSNGSQGQNAADNGSMNQFGMQYYGMTYEDNIPDAVPDYYAGNSHINLVA